MIHLAGKRSCHDQAGTDGSTMGQDQTTSPRAAEIAQGRASARGQSRLLRRHPLGTSQRRAVEGFAREIPLSQHLLAPAARLGGGGPVAENLAMLPGRAGRGRTTRLVRDLRRRQLRAGKKRGACVGKSKRGKGTQWMVVADGKGIPLGKRLGPAGPHESTLIEKTLDAVAVPRPGRRGGRPRKKPQ